jgi:arginyl-tRNA synthetase
VRPIEEILRSKFSVAIGRAFGPENVTDPLIKSADPKFADYQSNVAMSLTKKVNLPPREVANQIVRHLDIADLCDPPTIAGPGFINLKLKKDWIAATLQQLLSEKGTHVVSQSFRAGVDRTLEPQTVVVDYGGPNVAKQMHIGHLRSTIIGDTIARTLAFLGHTTIRQNHIGDFGTQFGMLIHYLRTNNLVDAPFTITDLDNYYKKATEQFRADEAFAVQARRTVVELQSGEPAATALWNRMRAVTHTHYTEVFKRLGVLLTDNDERGESFYANRLPLLIERVRQTLEIGGDGSNVTLRGGAVAPKEWQVNLAAVPEPDAAEARGALNTADALSRIEESKESAAITKPFAAISDGALCIFLPGYVDRDGKPLPLMIQKSDGGYPYSATDLAALFFRVQETKTTPADQKPLTSDWHASRIIYLTDARQAQHFAMVFDAFRAARWDHFDDSAQAAALEHASFGSMLGGDGKPYKTRSGNSVALLGLLDEAFERAAEEVRQKNADLSPEKQQRVAEAVSIAAVKYADLRPDRTTDYVFDPNTMVKFEGNTGPYLQYAYTRIQSIFRKADTTPEKVGPGPLLLDDPAEQLLAKKIIQFPGIIEAVARDLKPHYLCTYLYELASLFSTFYESCPVIKPAPPEDIRQSRLRLCNLVARILHIGLVDLLGIQTLDEM